MEQRDLIRDQIEKLGRVLGKIISDFMGLKTEGKINQGIELSHQQLKSELDIDIDHLLQLSEDQMKQYLYKRKFTEENLERLSSLLLKLGRVEDSKLPYYKAALTLLNLADENSGTLSYGRLAEKEDLVEQINQLSEDFKN